MPIGGARQRVQTSARGADAPADARAWQTLANLSASPNFVAARCAARALAAPRGGSRREMRSQAVRGGIARGATMAECAARGRGAAVVAKAPARAARRAGCFVMRAPCGDVRAQTLHTPPTVVAWCAYNARELGSSCWWYLLCTWRLFLRGADVSARLWSARCGLGGTRGARVVCVGPCVPLGGAGMAQRWIQRHARAPSVGRRSLLQTARRTL